MASVGTIIMLLQYLKDGHPAIYMPPLLPPPSCESKLITRADDTEEVVKERLRVYHDKVSWSAFFIATCLCFRLLLNSI